MFEFRGRRDIYFPFLGTSGDVPITPLYEYFPVGFKTLQRFLGEELGLPCRFAVTRKPGGKTDNAEVRRLTRETTPLVESLSLDEAFLDLARVLAGRTELKKARGSLLAPLLGRLTRKRA